MNLSISSSRRREQLTWTELKTGAMQVRSRLEDCQGSLFRCSRMATT